MISYFFLLIIFTCLQIYWQNRIKRIIYWTLPSLDYLILINTAVGEEFIFRILPHLICESHFGIRLIISSFIFGLLHGIPLIKRSSEIETDETIVTVITAMKMGLMLILIERLFTNSIYWYVSCCVIHGLNNMIFIHNNNKNLAYNPTKSGFVMIKSNY